MPIYRDKEIEFRIAKKYHCWKENKSWWKNQYSSWWRKGFLAQVQWKIPNDPINLDRKAQAIARNCQNCSTTSLVGNWNRATQPPFFFLHGRRNTGSFIWICSLFNSCISRRSWILFLCPCKWALRLKARWLNRWTGTTKRRTRPPTRWWTTCLQAH